MSYNNHSDHTVLVNGDGVSPLVAGLPEGWDIGRDFDGKIYFIDHKSKKTTWTDPRHCRNSSSSDENWAPNYESQLLLQKQQQQQQHFVQVHKPQVSAVQLNNQLHQHQNANQQYLNHQQQQQHYVALQQAQHSPQRSAYEFHQQQQQQQQQFINKPTNLNLTYSSSDHVSSSSSLDTSCSPFHSNSDIYVNNNNSNNNLRQEEEWRQRQEEMLRQYLNSAQSDLKAKQELVDIKQQRLSLAQDEFNHLNNALATLSVSTTSSNSTSPNFTRNNNNNICHSHSSSTSSTTSNNNNNNSNYTSPYMGSHNNFRNYNPCSRNNSFLSVTSEQNSSQICIGDGFTANSQTSLNSTGSTASTKYDPELLKYDVQHAKARVQRLKRELANIDTEMAYKQKGVETLAQVKAKFSDDHPYSVTQDEANAIRTELNNIQKSLTNGEQEKVELMKSLACLKDDLTRLQHSESSLDVSTAINAMEKFSTASQTDISGEMVPVGARLAEMSRLRLQYDEARRNVQDIQQSLGTMEERMNPGQLESDKDRLLLIQDKEQLMRELRSISPRSRSKAEMAEVKSKIKRLEQDLNNATEVSNRCIADRLKLHEEKQQLLQQLKDAMRNVSRLESQLKLLSASTFSMSSSSSLGSLSSSHASSKGSLSSLSFTDIYGLSTTVPTDPTMLDLHRRVDKILNHGQPQQTESGLQSAEESLSPESETGHSSVSASQLNAPQTLSPRSSLSSMSPPISPQDNNNNNTTLPGHPPSYDQAFGGVDRQKRLIIQQQLNEAKQLTDQIAELNLNKNRIVPKLQTISETVACGREIEKLLNEHYGSSDTSFGSTALSPISEMVTNSPKSQHSKGSAVSDESVAGDSGVFEAATRSHNQPGVSSLKDDEQLSGLPLMNLETAQVQIKLRYALADALLHVGIERARNLSALFIPERRKICIKASLLPSLTQSNWSFCTTAISNIEKPTFGENFPLSVPKTRLSSRTLQVTIWSIGMDGKEDCLGSAQVSLADFDIETVSVKWYNVLSFHFMQQPLCDTPKSGALKHNKHLKQESDLSMTSAVSSKTNTLKEESSDESTIISSQTSTLTRNIGPETFLALGKAIACHEGEIEESDEDEEEEDDSFAIPTLSEVMESVEQVTNMNLEDKETNTECVFLQPSAARKGVSPQEGKEESSTLVKRSQTFSPSAQVNKNDYICKINRSDSDSAMSINKRLEFQRTMMERRSLRVPPSTFMASLKENTTDNKCGAKPKKKSRNTAKKSHVQALQTPLDLELDLAAQQTKLNLLQDEIDRLKAIKEKLEEVKKNGSKEMPTWLNENEKFEQMLTKLQTENQEFQSVEDRRVDKMMKKTSKDIYKLRKTKTASKGQIDLQAFKEKMAFFTTLHNEVPVVTQDEENESKSSTLKLTSGDEPLSLVLPELAADKHEEVSNSCETVNTLTGDEERFTYEIDPEIGVIV